MRKSAKIFDSLNRILKLNANTILKFHLKLKNVAILTLKWNLRLSQPFNIKRMDWKCNEIFEKSKNSDILADFLWVDF